MSTKSLILKLIVDAFKKAIIKSIWPVDNSRFFLGLELGKIVEVNTGKNIGSNLVFSGTHTIYDIALDCKDRIWFFDAGLSLRSITLGASNSEEVCQGEFWGTLYL